jgi:hypothetical protein
MASVVYVNTSLPAEQFNLIQHLQQVFNTPIEENPETRRWTILNSQDIDVKHIQEEFLKLELQHRTSVADRKACRALLLNEVDAERNKMFYLQEMTVLKSDSIQEDIIEETQDRGKAQGLEILYDVNSQVFTASPTSHFCARELRQIFGKLPYGWEIEVLNVQDRAANKQFKVVEGPIRRDFGIHGYQLIEKIEARAQEHSARVAYSETSKTFAIIKLPLKSRRLDKISNSAILGREKKQRRYHEFIVKTLKNDLYGNRRFRLKEDRFYSARIAANIVQMVLKVTITEDDLKTLDPARIEDPEYLRKVVFELGQAKRREQEKAESR